jgi:hypothetical protein
MPHLRKSAVEQIKLEAKAEAFALAAEYVDGRRFGRTGSAQNLEEHKRLHGEYIA